MSSTCWRLRRCRSSPSRPWRSPSRGLAAGVTAKDLVLAIIARIGTGGGQGYVLEYRGEAIRNLSMEGRMTICNMSIEAGARAGMIAPDDTTFAYLEGREHAPGARRWDRAVEHWRSLATDDDAEFDAEVLIDASELTLSSPGAPTPPRVCRWASGCRCRPRSPTRTSARRPRRRWPTWVSMRACRCATSPWTRSSSARAPTVESRICGRRPRCCGAGRSPRASA